MGRRKSINGVTSQGTPALNKMIYVRVPEAWEGALVKEAYEKKLTFSELIRELIKPEGL